MPKPNGSLRFRLTEEDYPYRNQPDEMRSVGQSPADLVSTPAPAASPTPAAPVRAPMQVDALPAMEPMPIDPAQFLGAQQPPIDIQPPMQFNEWAHSDLWPFGEFYNRKEAMEMYRLYLRTYDTTAKIKLKMSPRYMYGGGYGQMMTHMRWMANQRIEMMKDRVRRHQRRQDVEWREKKFDYEKQQDQARATRQDRSDRAAAYWRQIGSLERELGDVRQLMESNAAIVHKELVQQWTAREAELSAQRDRLKRAYAEEFPEINADLFGGTLGTTEKAPPVGQTIKLRIKTPEGWKEYEGPSTQLDALRKRAQDYGYEVE